MSTLGRSGFRAALLGMLLVLALVTSAVAVSNPMTSTLAGTGPNSSRTFTLVAQVTEQPTYFHYEYTLTFDPTWSPRPLSSFSVANLDRLAFTNAGTSLPGNFVSPVFNPLDPNQNSVLWTATTPLQYSAGGSARFWFDSIYPYQVVSTSAAGGGISASGQTLGMIPEPTTLAAVSLGFAGLCGGLLRRLRARKA